jgi:hypothetical protein
MLVYIFISSLFSYKLINSTIIINYVVNSGFIFSILIIVTTLLGINFSTYPSGIGTKGLFPSGNGTGLYVGAISFLSLIQFNYRRTLKAAFVATVICFTSVFITTKASFLFLIADIVYLFVHILKRKGKIIFVLVFILGSVKIFDRLQDVFSVIISRYENSQNLFKFIASSRDVFIINAFKEFKLDNLYAFRLLMGFGAYISFRDPLNPGVFYDTLENDFFDVFFQYGTIGLMLYLFICIRILYITYNSKVKGLTLLLLMIVVYSITAGHTLFNATSGLLLAYIPILGKYINFSHSFNDRFS